MGQTIDQQVQSALGMISAGLKDQENKTYSPTPSFMMSARRIDAANITDRRLKTEAMDLNSYSLKSIARLDMTVDQRETAVSEGIKYLEGKRNTYHRLMQVPGGLEKHLQDNPHARVRSVTDLDWMKSNTNMLLKDLYSQKQFASAQKTRISDYKDTQAELLNELKDGMTVVGQTGKVQMAYNDLETSSTSYQAPGGPESMKGNSQYDPAYARAMIGRLEDLMLNGMQDKAYRSTQELATEYEQYNDLKLAANNMDRFKVMDMLKETPAIDVANPDSKLMVYNFEGKLPDGKGGFTEPTLDGDGNPVPVAVSSYNEAVDKAMLNMNNGDWKQAKYWLDAANTVQFSQEGGVNAPTFDSRYRKLLDKGFGAKMNQMWGSLTFAGQKISKQSGIPDDLKHAFSVEGAGTLLGAPLDGGFSQDDLRGAKLKVDDLFAIIGASIFGPDAKSGVWNGDTPTVFTKKSQRSPSGTDRYKAGEEAWRNPEVLSHFFDGTLMDDGTITDWSKVSNWDKHKQQQKNMSKVDFWSDLHLGPFTGVLKADETGSATTKQSTINYMKNLIGIRRDITAMMTNKSLMDSADSTERAKGLAAYSTNSIFLQPSDIDPERAVGEKIYPDDEPVEDKSIQIDKDKLNKGLVNTPSDSLAAGFVGLSGHPLFETTVKTVQEKNIMNRELSVLQSPFPYLVDVSIPEKSITGREPSHIVDVSFDKSLPGTHYNQKTHQWLDADTDGTFTTVGKASEEEVRELDDKMTASPGDFPQVGADRKLLFDTRQNSFYSKDKQGILEIIRKAIPSDLEHIQAGIAAGNYTQRPLNPDEQELQEKYKDYVGREDDDLGVGPTLAALDRMNEPNIFDERKVSEIEYVKKMTELDQSGLINKVIHSMFGEDRIFGLGGDKEVPQGKGEKLRIFEGKKRKAEQWLAKKKVEYWDAYNEGTGPRISPVDFMTGNTGFEEWLAKELRIERKGYGLDHGINEGSAYDKYIKGMERISPVGELPEKYGIVVDEEGDKPDLSHFYRMAGQAGRF